ncbi:hypothetical protein Leryth_013451 [Lithospermum erythrorhizon]|nr:hypothetical protein Leryth_013451 [Lithospermum erythrorhizon]
MENTDMQRRDHQELDSVNLLTNSLGSLVRIDELYVGIDDVYSPDSNGKWGHFSIRGYVGEMRKKNKRICAPFETEDENFLDEQLLPIEVRKFRYWRCKDCILGNCSSRPTRELDLVSEPPPNGRIPEGTCSNMALKDNAGATKSNNNKVATVDMRETVFSGSGSGSRKSKNQIIDGGHPAKLPPSIGKRAVCSVSPNSNAIELGECTHRCITDPDPRDMCYPITGVCPNRKKNISELEPGVTVPCDIFIYDAAKCPETEAVVDADKSTKSPSIQVEEQDDVSTESDEALIRSIDHRRKTKKVRLLTDLLSGKGNKRGDCAIEDCSAASHGVGLVTDAENRSLPEDGGKDKQRLPSKRRTSQVENSHNLEIRGLTNVSKKVRSARVNVDRLNVTREVSRSEAEESLHSEPKQGKSLSSPIPVTDEQTGRGNYDAGALDDTASITSGRREKDKGKRPVIDNGDTFLAPAYSSTLGEVIFQRKRRESLQIVSATKQYLSENETSTNVGLDLSLGSALSSEAVAKRNIFSANPTVLKPSYRPSYPPCKGKNVAEDLGMFKNSSPSQSGRKELPWDLNERIVNSTTLSFDNQKNSAPFDYRDNAIQGRMDFCNPSLKVKLAEVHGNSTPHNRQNDQRVRKAVEQASSDDIPMELVGFLAEKQYEKRIQMEQGYSSGEYQSLLNKTSNAIGGCNKVYGNGPMAWFSRDVTGTARSSHANATKGIILAVDNKMAAESMSKLDAHKWSCQEVDQRKLLSAVPENQQILSSSIQFPCTNSITAGTRPSEVEKPAWLSKNDNMPIALEVSHGYTSTLSGSMENQSRVELQHKGRTVSDIKAEEMRMQNKKQQIANMSVLGELKPKPRSFPNQHSNETIPAMQLLSLIQNGMSSDAAFDGDSSRFVGKPFFPSNYQPRLSIDERSRSYTRPLLANQHQRSGVANTGHTSFRSQELGESRSWAQLHQQIGRSGSLHRQNWEKLGAAYPLQFRHPGPGLERQNWDRQIGVSVSSRPMKFQLHSGRFESCPPIIDLEAYNASGSASARRQAEEEKQCVLNQNPADFSSPEPGNQYTLSGGDIKLLHSPRSVDFTDGRGRRRQQKATATRGREQARGHAS